MAGISGDYLIASSRINGPRRYADARLDDVLRTSEQNWARGLTARRAQHHPDDEAADGLVPMTAASVARLSRARGAYSVPSINTVLYLQQLSLSGPIAGLDAYANVRVLHLNNNLITSISGLKSCVHLRSLLLHVNLLTSIGDGLDGCAQLDTLNLACNKITAVTGVPPSVSSLNLAGAGLGSPASYAGLAAIHGLEVLDLQRNQIGGEGIIEALRGLPKLRVLYLQSNPITSSLPNYRRRLVSSLTGLSYLDDSPVDDLERVGAIAWAAGGRAAEADARKNHREAKAAESRRATAAFAAARRARLAALAASAASNVWGGGLGRGPVATAEAIAALAEGGGGEGECVFCREPLGGEAPCPPVLCMPCGHVFHSACLVRWLTRFSCRCPVCRHRLPATAAGDNGDHNGDDNGNDNGDDDGDAVAAARAADAAESAALAALLVAGGRRAPSRDGDDPSRDDEPSRDGDPSRDATPWWVRDLLRRRFGPIGPSPPRQPFLSESLLGESLLGEPSLGEPSLGEPAGDGQATLVDASRSARARELMMAAGAGLPATARPDTRGAAGGDSRGSDSRGSDFPVTDSPVTDSTDCRVSDRRGGGSDKGGRRPGGGAAAILAALAAAPASRTRSARPAPLAPAPAEPGLESVSSGREPWDKGGGAAAVLLGVPGGEGLSVWDTVDVAVAANDAGLEF